MYLKFYYREIHGSWKRFFLNPVNILVITFFFASCYSPSTLWAKESKPVEIGLEEHLGKNIPTDLFFNDETGKKVFLKDIITLPTILCLVYYRCPSICTPLLGGVADVMGKMNMVPGKEYLTLTISIDENETYQLASDKKRNFVKSLNKPIPANGWRFFTGTSENIHALANSVGFRFKRTGKDFAHPAVLTILAPGGKIVRYFNGITFLPFDMKMALVEAGKGQVGPTINRVLLYCFSYDPEGRNYAFNILKVTATLTILFAAVFLAALLIKSRKTKET